MHDKMGKQQRDNRLNFLSCGNRVAVPLTLFE